MSSSRPQEPTGKPVPLGNFPKRSAHLSGWPEPLHDVLDLLVERAGEVDVTTTRSELAAALTLDAFRNKTAAELSILLSRYRDTEIKYYPEADET